MRFAFPPYGPGAAAMHLAEAERAERRRRLEQLIPVARRIEARLEAGGSQP